MTGAPLLDLVAAGALLVGLPALTLLQLRHAEGMEIRPLPVYLSSALTLLLMGGACLALGARRGGLAGVGLVPLPFRPLLAWSVVLTVAGLAVLLLFRVLAGALGARETPLLRRLLPRTGRERAAFVGLSIAAGVGEELAYRGYLVTLLAPALGGLGAGALTSAVFGMLHAYQGALGIVRTATLGGLLAWGFLASGSLWPPIVAHAALDVLAGTALAERLMVPGADSGVSEGEGTPQRAVRPDGPGDDGAPSPKP